MQEYERNCPRCGEAFLAKRPKGIYCSAACRVSVHRKKQRLEWRQYLALVEAGAVPVPDAE